MQLHTYVKALERGGRSGGLCVFRKDPLRSTCIKLHDSTRAIISRHEALLRHVKNMEKATNKSLKCIRTLIRRGREIIDQRQDHRVLDAEKERELLNEFQEYSIPYQVTQNAKFECSQLLKKMWKGWQLSI